MLAGDSNTRNLYEWEIFPKLNSTASSSFHVHNFTTPPNNSPECKDGLHPTTTDGVCDARWADRDSVFIFNTPLSANQVLAPPTNTTAAGVVGGGAGAGAATTCIRLSLRFLANQAIAAKDDPAGHAHGVARLNLSNWDGVSYPLANIAPQLSDSVGNQFSTLSTPAARQAVKLAAAIKRLPSGVGDGVSVGTAAPDLLWFSHGLWRLPSEEALADCQQRFGLEAELLPDWIQNGVNVVWLTPPRVRTSLPPHENKTRMASAEAACVRQIAVRHGVPFFDTWRFTSAGISPTTERDPHGRSSYDVGDGVDRDMVWNEDVHLVPAAQRGVFYGGLWPLVLAAHRTRFGNRSIGTAQTAS
jgi:hypothetical protein